MFGFDRLELSDGTTTISLIDSPYDITLSGLDLGVATLRPGTLGGNAPYTDVPCTIPINITGTCPANVYTALIAVWTLLDQAQRFWRGDNVSPVVIKARANGSAVATSVQALILRRMDTDAPVALPAVYETTVGNFTAQDVQLQFMRRGQWIGATETASSAATPAGNIFTITLPALTTLSPVRLDMTYPTQGAFDGASSAPIVITTNDSNKIAIVEAESIGASGIWTVVVPAAGQLARGGSVLSGATTTTESFTSTIASPSLLQQAGLFGIWAVMKSAGIRNHLLRFQFFTLGPSSILTPFATFQPISNAPQPCFLGLVALPGDLGAQTYRLSAQADQADTLTIDYLVFMRIDQFTNIVGVNTLLQIPVTTYPNGTVMKLFIDPAVDTRITPRFARSTSTNTLIADASYAGNAFFNHSGTSLAGVLLWCGGTTITTYRQSDAAAALYNSTITATRRRAYLTLP